MGVEDMLDEVCALELELLEPSTQADRGRLDELLHADFLEIGASGRIWDRDSVIAAVASDPGSRPDVADLSGAAIGDGIVLVTYTAQATQRVTRRSSLWVRAAERWQCRFHQGTPA